MTGEAIWRVGITRRMQRAMNAGTELLDDFGVADGAVDRCQIDGTRTLLERGIDIGMALAAGLLTMSGRQECGFIDIEGATFELAIGVDRRVTVASQAVLGGGGGGVEDLADLVR